MLDIKLRPLKDTIFDPVCNFIPGFIHPLHVTGLAFLSGLASCYSSATCSTGSAVLLWITNRALDCLDGALARHRKQTSDLGGFLDLLGDFIVYGLVPISCGFPYLFPEHGDTSTSAARLGLSIAFVINSFFINNFVLFYTAAILEKRKASDPDKGANKLKELTSVAMRPALVEGTESGLIFTIMLAMPKYTEPLCWIMTAGVALGTAQRVRWLMKALT